MRCGYTVFELVVTVLIVTVLATSIGVGFVKLLSLQERDREEAYIREKLSDLCAVYADFASIGSTFSVSSSREANIVSYRPETGGMSFETGRVSHVAYLTTAATNGTIDLNVYSFVNGTNVTSRMFSNSKNGIVSKWTRFLHGDASLLTVPSGQLDVRNVQYTITPLGVNGTDANGAPDERFVGFNVYSNAVVGNLKATAWYTYRNSKKELVLTNATVERLVRLWNHE